MYSPTKNSIDSWFSLFSHLMGGNVILRVVSLIFLLIPSMVYSEVGFRDLKVGESRELIYKHCSKLSNNFQCYGIDDLKFNFEFEESEVIKTYNKEGESFRDIVVGNEIYTINPHCSMDDRTVWVCYGDTRVKFRFHKLKIRSFSIVSSPFDIISVVSVDIGPIYQTFLDNIVGDPTNPYIKLKKSLDSKYEMEWKFTERDRKLFNENEKESLWTSYNGGEIFSQILREEYSDLRLFVHYHTKEDGKKLSEERRSQNVNFDDF